MEVGVTNLVNRQNSRKFAPLICCLHSATDEARAMVHPRVQIVELGKQPGIDGSMVTKLIRLFRRVRPHIVHSHNWPTFLYTVIAARLAGVPVLVHGEHGYEDQLEIGRRLATKRFLSRRVTQLATVSLDLERVLIERWNVPPERVLCVPNGVDLDRFRVTPNLEALRDELGLGPGHPVVIGIGRFGPVKDFQTLIRGFARVHSLRPEARLLLVGWGDDHVELEELAESLGVRSAVIFTGSRHDVPELLSLSDVYVNSSLFEGMSNTILEAMASARPVVATSVGGNPELVRDGETGFLFPAGDDVALAGRLDLLLGETALRATMGKAGREIVARDHPIAKTVEAYDNMYLENTLRWELRRSEPSTQSVRRAAARALRYSGLTWMRRTTQRNFLTILAYHRVLPLQESLGYPFQSMVMPRDLFEHQISHLRKHYSILTLGEGVGRLRARDLPPRAVAVTFDDGYRDNFEVAFPVLKRYGVSATFFVVTRALDGRIRLLWDEVLTRVRDLQKNGFHDALLGDSLPAWTHDRVRMLKEGAPADRIGERIVRDLNRVPLRERELVMDALRRAAPTETGSSDPALMGWDEVRELQRAGMAIGAHTASHSFLDELEPAAARGEIDESIRTLEDRLGTRATLFSYPRGRFKHDVKRWLQEAGIEAAVTTELGRNAPGADLYELRRLDAGYCRIDAGCDTVLLDVEIQGWFQPIRVSFIPS
ncbi:MAG TPA: glycosyltransferase [Candidatus Dormibacteraeota bacterium]|nr:glycosyltransferase [Candidatus Dormibacteraeota bacterium]